ncbi:hypothetical protein [Xenorhabdus griffiniae]|uniref:hypothetical protein n=1 Tax=Xenorhabdus griffiniae TaxID=351672 RepID=UPI002359FF96|nr:hypothetical protein [Xenorhabdus griffiniae]MDC9607349.1 hypothetical protein [Xenorhabdus griffiniae]
MRLTSAVTFSPLTVAGLFHSITGAVAHCPDDDLNVARRGASGGNSIQIIAGIQAEVTAIPTATTLTEPLGWDR